MIPVPVFGSESQFWLSGLQLLSFEIEFLQIFTSERNWYQISHDTTKFLWFTYVNRGHVLVGPPNLKCGPEYRYIMYVCIRSGILYQTAGRLNKALTLKQRRVYMNIEQVWSTKKHYYFNEKSYIISTEYIKLSVYIYTCNVSQISFTILSFISTWSREIMIWFVVFLVTKYFLGNQKFKL